ncbi:MAG: SBBP repeat-containing protein [Bryobacteraceae bacterium]
MKLCVSLSLILLALTVFPATSSAAGAPAAKASELLDQLPLRFEPNTGHLSGDVRFISRTPEFNLYLTETGAAFALPHSGDSGKASIFRMELPGANPHPKTEGLAPLPSRSSYFLGNRPERWSRNVLHFEKVLYREVFPGIDLVYYGKDSRLEYDFVVAPGADPRLIRMRFEGPERLRVDESGALVMESGRLALQQLRPVVFQEDAARKERREIEGRYVLLAHNEVGFALGAYDATRPLVIDPVLVHSSYVGGSERDMIAGVGVDKHGYIWVAGNTRSLNLPLAGDPIRHEFNFNQDLFVAKLDPRRDGPAALVYATYIGGSGADQVRGVHVDPDGRVYMTGETASFDFPLGGNAWRTGNEGSLRNAFVTKVDTLGNEGEFALVYSSYLGGSETDVGTAITADASGKIYVVGYTTSPDFPIAGGPVQPNGRGGFDAFLSIFDPSLPSAETLVYSTYFGGDSTDVALGVAVDAQGHPYFTGYTFSSDFPVEGDPFQSWHAGGGDAFLVKLDLSKPGLDALVYGTYFGGTSHDVAYAIALDPAGNIYLTGYTHSLDLPVTAGAYRTNRAGMSDVFVARLSLRETSRAQLTWSTYLGGASSDVAFGIALDSAGKVLVTGYTYSPDFPLRGEAVQTHNRGGAGDAFLARLDPEAQGQESLLYSTYFGGIFGDAGYGVAVDQSNGMVYVAGATLSPDIPVGGTSARNHLAGLEDGFIAGFDLCQFSVAPGPGAGAIGANGGTGGILVTTAGACGWSAAASADWIVIESGQSGSGNGMVEFRIQENLSSEPRSAAVRIGGRTYTVTQEARGGGAFVPQLPDAPETPENPEQSAGIIKAVVNGASFGPGVAPGGLITIFYDGIQTSTAAPEGVWPYRLNDITVTVNGQAIPLIYISAEQKQINAQLPYEVAPGTAAVIVTKGGISTAPFYFEVQASAPGILLWENTRAVAFNEDGSLNAAGNGAAQGEVVTVYLLNIGATDADAGANKTNAAAPSAPLARSAFPHTATLGGVDAVVEFLGLSPGWIGLAQANIRVPALPPGEHDLIVTVGGFTSNAAKITVR